MSVVHGLGASFNDEWNLGSSRIYDIGMLLSFCIGGAIYYMLSWAWPIAILPAGFGSMGWESMARNGEEEIDGVEILAGKETEKLQTKEGSKWKVEV